MATQPSRFLTPEEFLRGEEESPERHEYLHGEVFAMAGGTPAHASIAANLITVAATALRDTDCNVRGSDLRLRTSPNGLFSYADVVISCGQELFDGTTLLNPRLIAEVLSDSTENYDRGKKFELYREITSFVEYLIVAQDRIYVEHHVRESPDTWVMRIVSRVEEAISLRSVPAVLPLRDIYRKVL